MNENILKLVNLASPKLGTKIIDFSDDFFGDVSRMLNDKKPVFIDFAPMLGQLYVRFWG